jgi:hypothetical protein
VPRDGALERLLERAALFVLDREHQVVHIAML